MSKIVKDCISGRARPIAPQLRVSLTSNRALALRRPPYVPTIPLAIPFPPPDGPMVTRCSGTRTPAPMMKTPPIAYSSMRFTSRRSAVRAASSREKRRSRPPSRGPATARHERAGHRVQGLERICVRDEVATRTLEIDRRGPRRRAHVHPRVGVGVEVAALHSGSW